MPEYRRFQRQSRRLALCGLMTALSVLLLSLGSFIPLATFACPMLAMLCLIPVICEFGPRTGQMVYAAAAPLALLLAADKELAFFYLFLGWYPVCRETVDRLPRALRIPAKCGIFTLAMAVMYSIIILLFQLEAIAAEFAEYSVWMTAGLLVLGNVAFLLMDRVLRQLTALYRYKRKKR